jgi:hypothetical protein
VLTIYRIRVNKTNNASKVDFSQKISSLTYVIVKEVKQMILSSNQLEVISWYVLTSNQFE